MSEPAVDVFMLFNEREAIAEKIDSYLGRAGIRTHFWSRDVPYGSNWRDFEERRLREATLVLVFLGEAGWGATHLELTRQAVRMEKRVLPVLIGQAPGEALLEADGLFTVLRYYSLRSLDTESLEGLVAEIRKALKESRPMSSEPATAESFEVSTANENANVNDTRNVNENEPLLINVRSETGTDGEFDQVIGVFRDRDDADRLQMLGDVRSLSREEKLRLAARLRLEISTNFPSSSEKNYLLALRDPRSIPAIRSWMLSALIWADGEGPGSRGLILKHLDPSFEPVMSVRFWVLAGLHSANATYVGLAANIAADDTDPEVKTLAMVVREPGDRATESRLSRDLQSGEWERIYPVLRTVRVVPIAGLAPAICAYFLQNPPNTTQAYDALFALASPSMAPVAAEVLRRTESLENIVMRVVDVSRAASAVAVENFTGFLTAFGAARVLVILIGLRSDPVRGNTAATLERSLNRFRRVAQPLASIPVYSSDTTRNQEECLGIGREVQTLTSVMIARDVKPPLAIGLFGDWGTGKSYFIQEMKDSVEKLSQRKYKGTRSPFCTEVAQIEFNAWHFVDTNLWASLVNHILSQLAARVVPNTAPQQEEENLLSQLASTKAAKEQAETEKQIIQTQSEELKKTQANRLGKEAKLRTVRDAWTLLASEPELREKTLAAMQQLGVPVMMTTVDDLRAVVAEGRTTALRMTGIANSLFLGERKWAAVGLILFVIAAPIVLHVIGTDIVTKAGALVAELVAVLCGVTTWMRSAIKKVNDNLKIVNDAKEKVEAQLAKPTSEQLKLEGEIAALAAKEGEISMRLTDATARALDLEEKIKALRENRSLATFLTERTRSDDYRKHLGLIATIRDDFHAMSERLTAAADAAATAAETAAQVDTRSIERIILYIDDLDRCPPAKVMEVLQAVHLLLAFPLFVVVVGVDPRWLLHSLHDQLPAFGNPGSLRANGEADAGNAGDGQTRNGSGVAGGGTDRWMTTPQNYLEKIFQIPFGLPPMSNTGFQRLMESLLIPKGKKKAEDGKKSPGQGPVPQQQAGDAAAVYPADQANNLSPLNNGSTAGGGSANGDGSSTPTAGMDEQTKNAKPIIDDLKQQQEEEQQQQSAEAFEVAEEAMIIRDWEASFARTLYGLIPTPRAIKRFTNIYRILKASVDVADLESFEGTESKPGTFQVPMLLLAMMIGSPDKCGKLFPQIITYARQNPSEAEFERALENPQLVVHHAIMTRILPLLKNTRFPTSPQAFIEWMPYVARFSFEVSKSLQEDELANSTAASAEPVSGGTSGRAPAAA